MLRDLLRSLGRRGRRHQALASAADDRWETVGQAPRTTSQMLVRIERVALDAYATHGLPTRPGHYRRRRGSPTWTFLGEHLTPEARWALLLERPTEAGWQYASLQELGRTGVQDLAAAATILDSCARLRSAWGRADLADPWQEMELAIQLGAQWQALESRRVKKTSEPRLRLTAPDDAVPDDGTPKAGRRKPRKKD